MSTPKFGTVSIRALLGTSSATTILINGEPVAGVRKYTLTQEAGVNLPLLTLEMHVDEATFEGECDVETMAIRAEPAADAARLKLDNIGMSLKGPDVFRLASAYASLSDDVRFKILESLALLTTTQAQMWALDLVDGPIRQVIDRDALLHAIHKGKLDEFERAVESAVAGRDAGAESSEQVSENAAKHSGEAPASRPTEAEAPPHAEMDVVDRGEGEE